MAAYRRDCFMKSVIKIAHTKEEAVEEALRELAATPEQVRIEVME